MTRTPRNEKTIFLRTTIPTGTRTIPAQSLCERPRVRAGLTRPTGPRGRRRSAAFASTCGFRFNTFESLPRGNARPRPSARHPTRRRGARRGDRKRGALALWKPSTRCPPLRRAGPPPVAVAPSFASSDYAPTAHDREGRTSAGSAAAAAAATRASRRSGSGSAGAAPSSAPRGRARARGGGGGVSHPYDGRSMVDLDPGRVDYQKFGARVRGDVAVLRARGRAGGPLVEARARRVRGARAGAEAATGGGRGGRGRVGRELDPEGRPRDGNRRATPGRQGREALARGRRGRRGGGWTVGTDEGARRIDLAQRVGDEIDLVLGRRVAAAAAKPAVAGRRPAPTTGPIRAVVDDSDDGDVGRGGPRGLLKRFRASVQEGRGAREAADTEVRPPPPPSSAAPIGRVARAREAPSPFREIAPRRAHGAHALARRGFRGPTVLMAEAEAARTARRRRCPRRRRRARRARRGSRRATPRRRRRRRRRRLGPVRVAGRRALLRRRLAPRARPSAVALAGGGYLGRAREFASDGGTRWARVPRVLVDAATSSGRPPSSTRPPRPPERPPHPEFIGDKSKVQRG